MGDAADGKGWFRSEHKGNPKELPLAVLISNHERTRSEPDFLEAYRPGQSWLLGYAIPPFQRPLVWDFARKVRFVESAASGLPLGNWVYNVDNGPWERIGGRARAPRTDHWLIDGQQRFSALADFLDDLFPVYGLYWSQVPVVDRRRFSNQVFPAYELALSDETALRRRYDTLNFGGVAHTADQRALPEEPLDGAPAPGPRR